MDGVVQMIEPLAIGADTFQINGLDVLETSNLVYGTTNPHDRHDSPEAPHDSVAILGSGMAPFKQVILGRIRPLLRYRATLACVVSSVATRLAHPAGMRGPSTISSNQLMAPKRFEESAGSPMARPTRSPAQRSVPRVGTQEAEGYAIKRHLLDQSRPPTLNRGLS